MISKDPFGEVLPVTLEVLERLFYELDLETPHNKMRSLRKIATIIPWNVSILAVVESLKDPILRFNSRQLAPVISIERTNHRLASITKKGSVQNYDDLEEGLFHISSMGDFSFSYQTLKKELDRMANRLMELFQENESILSEEIKVNLLCRLMHQEEGFTGNQSDYNNPDNTYISKVIISKLGIPISLSALYLLVGRRVGMPIYGTNMPLHFLLQYESPTYSTYIDPFHGGVLLDKKTCLKFLNANGFKPQRKYFAKATTLSILKRMYRNLIHLYRKAAIPEVEEILTRQLMILENKSNLLD